MTAHTNYLMVTALIEPDNGQFASYCPEFDVASSGDTVEQAFNSLRDAVELHISSLIDHGEFERELRERKISVHPSLPAEMEVRTQLRPGAFVSPLPTRVAEPLHA